MSEDRRRAISTPGDRPDPANRGPGTVAVSVGVHLVAIAVLIRIAIVPYAWLGLGSPAKPEATHLVYLRTPAEASPTQAPRAGGDNRESEKGAPVAPLAAPSATPSELPPAPPKGAVVPQAEGGSGPVVGAGGPTKGVVPAFTDPRIWEPTDPAPIRVRPLNERLDSAIAARVHFLEDSLTALGPQRAPGDWSFTGKDGKKYGIDQKYIHIGNIQIPTALLALLPLNVQGNPSTYQNGRFFHMIRGEILEQEARSVRDADFNEAVKELRERKQKERADKEAADHTIPLAPPPVKIIP